MTNKRLETTSSEHLPRKSPRWPTWLWIVAISLALLAMLSFLFLTAV